MPDESPADLLDEAEEHAAELRSVCDPATGGDVVNDIDTALKFSAFARLTGHVDDRRNALRRLRDLLPRDGDGDDLGERIDLELAALGRP